MGRSMRAPLTKQMSAAQGWSGWLGVPPARSPDFRALLSAPAWRRLPDAVRKRFAHDRAAARVVIYRGRMMVKASMLGRCFAQVCRLMGTPVAPFVHDDVPVTVRVFDKPDDGGTVWERRYDFPGRAPVIVSSVKQIEYDGTLVEALGAGLRMRLKVFERDGALHFLSTGYFFQIGRLRFELPSWLPPGATHVVHEDRGGGRFLFTLHTAQRGNDPGNGAMYWQSGLFM